MHDSDNTPDIEDIYYKPNYTMLLNRIQEIKDVRKNKLLEKLLDGEWHSENELVRFARKFGYIGVVTLGTMINSLKQRIDSKFLVSKSIKDINYYKISDNFCKLNFSYFSTRFIAIMFNINIKYKK
jgi:hypothetical protein